MTRKARENVERYGRWDSVGLLPVAARLAACYWLPLLLSVVVLSRSLYFVKVRENFVVFY